MSVKPTETDIIRKVSMLATFISIFNCCILFRNTVDYAVSYKKLIIMAVNLGGH